MFRSALEENSIELERNQHMFTSYKAIIKELNDYLIKINENYPINSLTINQLYKHDPLFLDLTFDLIKQVLHCKECSSIVNTYIEKSNSVNLTDHVNTPLSIKEEEIVNMNSNNDNTDKQVSTLFILKLQLLPLTCTFQIYSFHSIFLQINTPKSR